MSSDQLWTRNINSPIFIASNVEFILFSLVAHSNYENPKENKEMEIYDLRKRLKSEAIWIEKAFKFPNFE